MIRKILNSTTIVAELNQENIQAREVHSLEALTSSLEEVSHENALLLILSNRTCLGLWESDFVQKLT